MNRSEKCFRFQTSHVAYGIETSDMKKKGGHVLFNNIENGIFPPAKIRANDSDEPTTYFMDLTKLFDPERDSKLDDFYFSQERPQLSLTESMPDGAWMLQKGIIKE